MNTEHDSHMGQGVPVIGTSPMGPWKPDPLSFSCRRFLKSSEISRFNFSHVSLVSTPNARSDNIPKTVEAIWVQ